MEFYKEDELRKKFTADELNELHEWIDCIPYSRPKKNLARDFSDGVLVAETIAHFFPTKVNLKSFFMAHSKKNKAINWSHLNDKIFPQFGIKKFKESTITKLMDAKPGYIEKVIFEIRSKMAEKIPSVAKKFDYHKTNIPTETKTAASKKKVLHSNRSRLPMFSKIELQLENEALEAAKSGIGDFCLKESSMITIKPTLCQVSIGAIPAVEMEPQIFDSCTPMCKSESAPMVRDVNNNLCENQSEKTLQAFDSSWFSYPIYDSPIPQVDVVDTNGLV